MTSTVNPALIAAEVARILGQLMALYASIQTANVASIPAITAEIAGLYNEYTVLTGGNSLNLTAEDIQASFIDETTTHPDNRPVAPAPVDPSSVEYTTQPEAVTHVTLPYPNVDRLANGKFVVWPSGINSLPGSTHVYP